MHSINGVNTITLTTIIYLQYHIFKTANEDWDKDLKVEVRERKEKKVKVFILQGCYPEFYGLPSHLSGLGTGIELCWLTPLWPSTMKIFQGELQSTHDTRSFFYYLRLSFIVLFYYANIQLFDGQLWAIWSSQADTI